MKIRRRALFIVLTGLDLSYRAVSFAPFRLQSALLSRPRTASPAKLRLCNLIPAVVDGSTVQQRRRLASVVSSASSSAEAHPSSETGRDVVELNRELDRLAERCSSIEEQVVHLASEAESLYIEAAGSRNTLSFNILLRAWGHACRVLAEGTADRDFDVTAASPASVRVYTARDAADHATRLLVETENEFNEWSKQEGNHVDQFTSQERVVPNEDSYNIVIYAWARSGTNEGAHVAERIFRRLMKSDRLKADSQSYNAVLRAWSFSRHPEALNRLSKLYGHVRELCLDKEKNIEISSCSYNNMLTFLVDQIIQAETTEEKVGMAERAHNMVNHMKETYEKTGHLESRPDVHHYTSLIDAYGKCNTVETCEKGEALLEELKEVGAENPEIAVLQPNSHTYNALMSGWMHTHSTQSAKRALALLDEMEKKWKEQEDSGVALREGFDCRPCEKTYVVAITALGDSDDDRRAQIALQMLRKMKDMAKEGDESVSPTIASYNAVLDVCAKCGRFKSLAIQTDALKIGFAVYKAAKLDPHVTLTSVTIVRILRCVAYLMTSGNEQNKVAAVVFEEAKKAGLVNFEVCKNLGKATTRPMRAKLLEETVNDKGRIDYNNLPSEWKRNAKVNRIQSKRYVNGSP